MARAKLSKTTIDKIKPNTKQPSGYITWDALQPGFGIRLTPQGTKTWLVQGRIGKGRAGKPYTISLGEVDTSLDADAMAAEIEAKRAKAVQIRKAARDGSVDPHAAPETPNHYTFSMLCDAFFENEDRRIEKRHPEAYARTTIENYKIQARARLKPEFGGTAADAITWEMVHDWFLRRKDESAISANRELSCLSAIMRYGVAKKKVNANPCKGHGRTREQGRTAHLKEHNIKKLLEALDKHEAQYLSDLEKRKKLKKKRLAKLEAKGRKKESPDREEVDERIFVAAVKILLRTGLRPGELCTLQHHDTGSGNYVDWSAKRLIFRDHKTSRAAKRKTVEVPIDNGTLDLLAGLIPAQMSNPYLLHRPGKQHWNVRMLERRWNDIMEKLKLPPSVTLYAARHTFGTLAIKKADPMVVSKLMKHARFSTTETYIHLAAEDAEEGSKDIGAAFDKIMG